VSVVSNSGTSTETDIEVTGSITVSDAPCDPTPNAKLTKWYRLRRDGKALVKYLLDSEVHTYAFSVAANAVLSFIPFIVLLYTLALSVFHSDNMANVVTEMVHYFLPSNQDWVASHLAAAAPHHGVQALSLVMILISCTGIFLPLEVALNQAWGVTKSRNYLKNQAVAFGLAILMVALGMMSVLLSAWQRQLLTFMFFYHTDNFLFREISYIWLAFSTGVACILFLFSIYWVLPNCKVPPLPVLRTAIVTGLLWLIAKNLFVVLLPMLDLKALYGPFYVSVGLLFWSYVSGLILFGGAQYSVARLSYRRSKLPERY
jgi:membrane protein